MACPVVILDRNVGPFRYWTWQQLPNFVLAAPVLITSLLASWTYYSHNTKQAVRATLPFLPAAASPSPLVTSTSIDDTHTGPEWRKEPGSSDDAEDRASASHPFLSPALLPFVHLHTALTLLLLVSAHVQIILRVCVTNPVLFWFVAAGGVGGTTSLDRNASQGHCALTTTRWIVYCVTWGSVSVVLWACFLPPA